MTTAVLIIFAASIGRALYNITIAPPRLTVDRILETLLEQKRVGE